MKPIILVPLVALALAGAGMGTYLAVAGQGSGEEAVVAEATPTPTPAAETLTPAATAEPTPAPAPTQTHAPAPTPTDWVTYQDAELGFSFPHPPGLTVTVDFSEPPNKSDAPRTRLLTFRDANGFPALGLAIIPNPKAIPLREWIDEFDPCISSDGVNALESASIGGQGGFWCPFNQLNEPNPIFYFQRNGVIFSLGPNVSGSMEGQIITPSLLTEGDFQRVIDGFNFAP